MDEGIDIDVEGPPPMMGFAGDYHVKLIEMAQTLASDGAKDLPDFLRRFRTIYRHLAASVDGALADLGAGPFGPMAMPGMQVPDVAKLLERTEGELGNL
jgi:hypothetical protein